MPHDNDPHHLGRFVAAQDAVWDRVRAELTKGQKLSHWMWFVFPQIAGLGHSTMAVTYAISGLDEAKAYLAHDVLAQRLAECTQLVGASGRPVTRIFGWPDDMKFKSSMTLFAKAQGGEGAYQDAIEKYFGGEYDDQTVIKLKLAGVR